MKKILTIEYDALKAILESQSWLRNPEILGGYEELDTYELMRKIEDESEVSDESEFTSEEKERYTKAYLQASAKKKVWQKNDIVIDPPEIQKSCKSYHFSTNEQLVEFAKRMNDTNSDNVFVTTDEGDMYVPANFILAYAKEWHLKPNVFWLADQYNKVLQDLWKKFKKTYRLSNDYLNEESSIKLGENKKDYAWFMKHCISEDNK